MFNGFDYKEALGLSQPVHSFTSPVTVAYGGFGASYGGHGGKGHARHNPASQYNDEVRCLSFVVVVVVACCDL